jgi:hypothetical protein
VTRVERLTLVKSLLRTFWFSARAVIAAASNAGRAIIRQLYRRLK